MTDKGQWAFAFEMERRGNGWTTVACKAHPLDAALELDKGKATAHNIYRNLSEIYKTFKRDESCIVTDNLTAPCTVYQVIGFSADNVKIDNSLHRFKVYPYPWLWDASQDDIREWNEY